jgi:UDP-N-acetylglucosamine 2-epimerase (non-hydrolysing)
MPLPEVHLVAGARAEAVKFAPVVTAMRDAGLLRPVLVADGRHPALVDRTLAAFGLATDVTLRAERASRGEVLTEMIGRLGELWAGRTPAAVLVQGNTITSLAGALAAHWHRIPLVHLDAGLRPGDLDSPFPKDSDRRLVAQLAALHLAPTPLAAINLLDEHIATRDVLVTGNTAVDATLAMAARRLPYENTSVAVAPNRLVVVSVQRGESGSEPLDRILGAVLDLVATYSDLTVIVSTRSDPVVRRQVDAALGGVERIIVTGPLAYPDLSRLLTEAYLVLTDSGGIQQEAPSFGVPVLVLRDGIEGVESLDAGGARLVGSDTDRIVGEASLLLDSQLRRDAMTAGGNPYGDGLAGRRTAQAVAALLGLAERPEPMPARAISHNFTFGANA